MKKVLLFSFLLLLIPNTAYAADSSVHVSVSNNGSDSNSNVSVRSTSQGSSTTCVNGNCTTSNGSSHSKVCINGNCTESDGNVDINEDNGKTQVKINNSTDNSTVKTSTINTPTPKVSPEDDDKSSTGEAARIIKKSTEKRQSILEEIKNILESFFKFWN